MLLERYCSRSAYAVQDSMTQRSRANARTIGTMYLAAFVGIITALQIPIAEARELTLAVASNFRETAEEIARRFTTETNIPVRLSFGSTGKLYAQIRYGAPFDVFLAADAARPIRLEEEGYVASASRVTYAIGTLHLVSTDEALRGRDCLQALQLGEFRRVAIANPDTAPYGRAARTYLESTGLWESVRLRAIQGENIAQTMQFVATGNATLGLIATAQVNGRIAPRLTCSAVVPKEHYAAIVQQAVVLAASKNLVEAQQFLQFLGSEGARQQITADGYLVPD